jgi:hypothetical protein
MSQAAGEGALKGTRVRTALQLPEQQSALTLDAQSETERD